MPQRPGLAFSHVGIFVSDIAAMEVFYSRQLEFTVTDRGQLPGPKGPVDLVFLSRDPDEHHQIVMASGRPTELNFNVVNQISLRADSLATLKAFHARLKEAEVREMLPVTHGNAMSIYFRDPEGNRLEIFIDTPWYVTQPMRVTLPIELPEDELLQWVEEHARKLPGFRPRAQWRAEMARRMGVS